MPPRWLAARYPECMRYVETPPPPVLRPFVRTLWLLEDGRGGPGEVERILPDGCIELIVHYGAPMRDLDEAPEESRARSIVAGQIRYAK